MMSNSGNDEAIAKAYRSVTEQQMEVAIKQAAKDEKFVRGYARAA